MTELPQALTNMHVRYLFTCIQPHKLYITLCRSYGTCFTNYNSKDGQHIKQECVVMDTIDYVTGT